MNGVSRRVFLGTGAAGGAALLTGGLNSLFVPSIAAAAAPGADEVWMEKSILELQALMASGELTSRALTLGYLQRIRALNPLAGRGDRDQSPRRSRRRAP